MRTYRRDGECHLATDSGDVITSVVAIQYVELSMNILHPLITEVTMVMTTTMSGTEGGGCGDRSRCPNTSEVSFAIHDNHRRVHRSMVLSGVGGRATINDAYFEASVLSNFADEFSPASIQ